MLAANSIRGGMLTVVASDGRRDVPLYSQRRQLVQSSPNQVFFFCRSGTSQSSDQITLRSKFPFVVTRVISSDAHILGESLTLTTYPDTMQVVRVRRATISRIPETKKVHLELEVSIQMENGESKQQIVVPVYLVRSA